MHQTDFDRRRAPRFAVRDNALVAIRGAALRDCQILDINEFGCRLRIPDFDPPGEFHLVNLERGVAYNCRVMWRQDPLAGTRFLETWSLSSAACPMWIRDAVSNNSARVRGMARGLRVAFGGKSVA